MNDRLIIHDRRYLINDISTTLNNGEVKMNLLRELVTFDFECECIKVTYQLVGEEPVTVEVYKTSGGGFEIWQIVLGEEPNQIAIDLYYNADHWVLNFVTETPITNGLYYAFVSNEGCPFVDFSEYVLQEGYDANLESFIVEPCE